MKKLVLLLVALSGLVPASSLKGQMAKRDVKHISANSFLAIRIDVRTLLEKINKSKKEFDELAEIFKDMSEIDLRKLDAITFQYGDPEGDRSVPSFAMTMEFSGKQDRNKFMRQFGEYEEAEINGKKYLKHPRANGPHFFFESDRKFTMATAKAIDDILRAGGGMGDLPSVIKSARPNSAVVLAYRQQADAIDMLNEFLDEFGQNVPEGMGKQLASVKSALLTLELSDNEPLQFDLKMGNAEAAKKIADELDGLCKLAGPVLVAGKTFLQSELNSLDPDEEDETKVMKAGLNGLQLLEKMLGARKIAADGNQVRFRIRIMGGVPELADLSAIGIMGALGIQRAPGPDFGDIEEKIK